MPYCPRCGTQNDEDTKFCKNCGSPMSGARRDWDKQTEKECEDTCSGHGKMGSRIWGLIVVLIGIWIVISFGISRIDSAPDWLKNFDFWWVFAFVVGALIIAFGVKAIIKG